MHSFITSIVQTIWALWYGGVFLWMLLESTFLPVPSELIMIPAWFLASKWEMSLIILFLCWTLWAIVWSTINYLLWKHLGWPVVHILIKKYGKYILLSEKHYKKSEDFFENHGNIATFTGRLLPWLRHLISIPAWVFHMNFKYFLIYTSLWAALWNCALISLWYLAWENQALIEQYSKEITWGIFISVFVIIILYIWYHKKKK